MEKYFANVTTQNGAAIPGALITVFVYGTSTPAPLFADAAGTIPTANPVTSDSNGFYEFYAANGRYSLTTSATNLFTRVVTDILIYDPAAGGPLVVYGGSVNASPVGNTNPDTGVFTTLAATGLITGANLSGTNTGDNATNSQYANDYRAANFVAGTDYIAPTGSIGAATGLTAGQVTTALGFTPYSAANPAGYTTNTGTVTSVALTTPVGLTTGGSPVTTSGTLAISFTAGYSIPTTASQSNWDTAFTNTLRWDGGATGLVAATGRTSLGATTVGGNLFTLTNPSAVTFPRFNADNTVSALDAATFRTAIGAGTGVGTVTSASVVSANGFAGSVATATSTPAITISTTVTGLVKGNGTALAAATVRTDYAEPTTALATGILKNTTGTGAHTIAVAGDFPTLNQSTTGSAAALTTARTIGGSSFNGTSNVTSFPVPGPIGGTTPSTGAFTTLSTTSDAAVGGALSTGSAWTLTGAIGGIAGSNRYIGAAGLANQWFQNVPTGGAHYWAINNITKMTLDAAGDLSVARLKTGFETRNVVSIFAGGGTYTNGFCINTNIGWFSDIFFDLHIHGYHYRIGGTVDLHVCNYTYSLSSPLSYSASNAGNWAPTVTLANVGGFVSVVLGVNDGDGYYLQCQVDIISTNASAAQLSGWTVTDAAPAGTAVTYTNKFGNVTASGTVTAPTFSGALSGNATTATALSGITTSQIFRYEGFTLDANTITGNRSGFTYALNAPHVGPIEHFEANGYGLQLNAAYTSGGLQISYRTRDGDLATWNSWYALRTTGNFVAGTDYIAPTGSIAAATGLTSGQVTTALGYTPGSAAGLATAVIGTNTTAVTGTAYVFTASLTLTLPASPSPGNIIYFSNRSAVATCVIARNGQNIMGLAEDLTIDGINYCGSLLFADATRGWVLL